MKKLMSMYMLILLIPCIGLGVCYGDLYLMTHNNVKQPYLDVARGQNAVLPVIAQRSE